MKHLSKLAAILAALVLACAFFGCSDGSDGSDGYQSISLSDGDYTLLIKQSADGMVEEYDIKATVSNNSCTFKSGSVTSTVDLTKQLTAVELAVFNAMSNDEKKAMVKEEMDIPEDAEISFDGNKVIVKANLSDAVLAEAQEFYQLTSIPADAKIETIKDKTEYKVTMFMNGMQMEFHIQKA